MALQRSIDSRRNQTDSILYLASWLLRPALALASIGLLSIAALAAPEAAPLIELKSPIVSDDVLAWSEKLTHPVECRELSDVPGTFFCLTESRGLLRQLMGRVSYFVEGEPSRTLAAESNPVYEASPQANYEGHDIKASDWRLFHKRVDLACAKLKEFCMNPLEAALREVVIGSAMRRRLPDYAVLGVTAGIEEFKAISSHEILHARFFLSRKYQKTVESFWHQNVEEAHREQITAALGRVYNLKGENGKYLLLNEFQAYLLQDDSETSDFGFYAKLYAPRLRQLLADSHRKATAIDLAPPQTAPLGTLVR